MGRQPAERPRTAYPYCAALDAAGLPRIRFHDLRHTFGTQAIKTCDVRELQGYMGHAHISTTMIYLHFAPKAEAAKRLGAAFATSEVPQDVPPVLPPTRQMA